MKLGLDISQIVYSGTGVSRYTQGLVQAIIKYDSVNDWVFFFSSLRQKLPEEIVQAIGKKGFTLKNFRLPPTLLSFVWNRLHLLDLKYFVGKLDWFISSDWVEPPSNSIKKATIVHDLVFLKYPQTVSWQILKTQQQRLIHVCRESSLVITDSNSTRRDVEQLLTFKKAKLCTIYPGVEVTTPSREALKQTLNKYHLNNKRFILAVGKLEPRKNLKRLVEAYSKIKPAQTPLVIVGPKGWGKQKLVGDNIKTLGYLSDEELFCLYQSCLLFVYPSLYEGFGYPLLEAANFKAPMAVSQSSSLKELGQGISMQFNPEKVSDMAEKIKALLDNKVLRKTLGEKAAQKAKQFSWKNTYYQLIGQLKQQ